MEKVETIDLQGKDYAKVAERIKAFREDCPNGLIETEPKIEGKMVIFKARILKDKSNEASAEATGHSIGGYEGKKGFEKQESIAIGRALAILGYMASGEIASCEEMEEFNEFQENKRTDELLEFKFKLDDVKTIEELREVYKESRGRGKEIDELIMNRKNQLTKDTNENS